MRTLGRTVPTLCWQAMAARTHFGRLLQAVGSRIYVLCLAVRRDNLHRDANPLPFIGPLLNLPDIC